MAEPIRGLLVEPSDEKVLDEGVRHLEQRIADKKRELKQLEAMIATTAAKLRVLHLALSAFFGTAPEASAASSGENMPNDETKWNAWKQRLPEPTGRIIDALLIQPLTATQIATQARIHTTNVSKYMAPLKNNSLLEQDGSRWKLKRL